jgi:energy-converting hydrogenase B subunit B
MNIYVLYFVMFALLVGALSSLKLCFHKNTSNVLIGEGLMAIIIATFLIVISKLGVSFAETVALFILVAGPVGTIAFSKVMRKKTEVIE